MAKERELMAKLVQPPAPILPHKHKKLSAAKETQEEAWVKLSSMSAWGFHGSYLKMKVPRKPLAKEGKKEDLGARKELLRVKNQRIRELNQAGPPAKVAVQR